MTLSHWVENGWLRPHNTSTKEIGNLLRIVDRDLSDAPPLILGESRRKDTAYLDACRSRRNTLEYDYVGGVTEEDVEELSEFVEGFKTEVLTWLKELHPELLSPK